MVQTRATAKTSTIDRAASVSRTVLDNLGPVTGRLPAIRDLPQERGLVTVGAFDGAELVAKGSGRVEWIALRVLVERVYVLHSRIAIEQYDWRCARCRSRRPLQIHHRKY